MSTKLKQIEKRFAERALKAKQKLKISYEKIANHSMIEINTVKRILNSKQPARLHEAIGIADALQTTVSYLVDYKDTRYMLSQTRLFRDWLVKEKELKKREMEYLAGKGKEIEDHLAYFEEILEKVDTFKEH